MSNQELLNSVSLQEAANIISDELISEKSRLEKTRASLQEEKKRYDEDYIRANDGDSSENAPLDKAKENLRLVTGKIIANLKLLQGMEGLEDVRFLVGVYDFIPLVENIRGVEEECLSYILQLFEVSNLEEIPDKIRDMYYKDLAVKIDALWNSCKGNGWSERSLQCANAFLDFYKIRKMPPYNYCGLIVPYSTVRLEINGTQLTYRIYPDNISFTDIGVIAANSRLAEALLGRMKGDSVTIQHTSQKSALVYKILDVY